MVLLGQQNHGMIIPAYIMYKIEFIAQMPIVSGMLLQPQTDSGYQRNKTDTCHYTLMMYGYMHFCNS